MNADTNERARQVWARWTGILLVLTNATAMFAVSTRLSFIAGRDPAATAARIVADETMFRIGLIFDLLTIAGVIPLLAGLYIVLRPVAPNLALLAMLWRIVENAVLAMLTFASFTALALLAGGETLRALDPRVAGEVAYALIRVHGAGFQVGFLFLGLGQLVFSLLWWRSRYVPRWLAGLGILGSTILAGMAVGIITWPPLYGLATMAYMAPMGLHEIGLGLWLAVRGIRIPEGRTG